MKHVTSGVRIGWIGEYSKKLYRHTMEMEQTMAILLAEIRTDQVKVDTILKEIKEEMRAGKELLKEKILGKLNAHHERMMAKDGFPAREN
jgi:hypothetical protein